MPQSQKESDYSPPIAKVIQYFSENYEFRKNIVTNDLEYRELGNEKFRTVNENTLYIELRKDAGIKASLTDVMVFLGSDYIQQYDPFMDYFEQIKDVYSPNLHGDYIERLANHVRAFEQKRFNNQFKKWLVRTVVCALVADYFNKNAFILVSDKQNNGKTTFSRFLVPPALQAYFAENIGIDRDSLIALSANFIGILDELSTLSKFEINALKSVMSKLYINVRHPYERRAKMTPRRISFFGSTNLTEFLTDEANVRWLCFEIHGIDWAYKDDIDIDIVWSQAYQLWKSGFKYELTKEEIEENERSNEQFRVITPEIELIQKHYSPGTKDEHEAQYTTTDFVERLNDISNGRIRLNAKNVGVALKKLGFIQHSIRGYGNSPYPVKIYFVKYNNPTTLLQTV
ncbi:MAG: virulence protein E [Parapedobacter sp.]|nr:MAG: virulence protein E [Parapedobacter sp.]